MPRVKSKTIRQNPFNSSSVVSSAGFPQSVDHEFGLGDAVFQAFVAHAIDERWAFGVGARVSAQTGADSLGSGEWQVMPGLGVRYMLFELGQDSYFVPSMRYAMSIPGNPGARRISEPQIAPTLNIDQLAYASAREDVCDRATRRADRLRARLGWEPGILNGNGGKPKWMRRRTFERLA